MVFKCMLKTDNVEEILHFQLVMGCYIVVDKFSLQSGIYIYMTTAVHRCIHIQLTLI